MSWNIHEQQRIIIEVIKNIHVFKTGFVVVIRGI